MRTTAPKSSPTALSGLRRVLVVGAGSSGLAATRLLASSGVEVVLVDDRAELPAEVHAEAGTAVTVRAGTSGVEALDDTVDLVVPSPGVPQGAPVLVEAERRGLPIWSEPELAWRVRPLRLLAVTGTNGKTSTTELLADMLARSGADTIACGNIGLPMTEAVVTASDDTVLVAELSSFQLRFAGSLRPEVGVLLNLAPDHLDWHGDVDAYHAAKARMWEAQQPDDWAVANADDPVTMRMQDAAPGRRACFSGTGLVPIGVGVVRDHLVGWMPDGSSTGPIVDIDALAAAPHRVANAAAAATAALLAGVSVSVIADAIVAFRPGRHRYEVVATSPSGVRYIDDSKATNAHAARAALRAGGPIVWIAGGRAKGASLAELADDLGDVRAAILIGEAADELAALCEAAGVPASRADSVEAAVERASELARAGDRVLLSPACASFDQFRDYRERGERFTAAARAAAQQPVSEDRT